MTLVSKITIEADKLESLSYKQGDKLIPITLKRVRMETRNDPGRTVIQCQIRIIYEPKISLIASISRTQYLVDINLDTYRADYLLKLSKNINGEVIVYDEEA